MSAVAIRLLVCTVLFATWVALVVFQVPGDEQIIDVIKYTLAMLGGYHAGDRINPPPSQQGAPSNFTQPIKDQA